MKEVTITQDQITEAFKKAKGNETATEVLTALFGEQKPDYSDYRNIKTYEDACDALGKEHPLIKEWLYLLSCSSRDLSAYLRLRIIAAALNNDPDFPRFTADEYRYYPYFILYNQDKIDEMNDDERKELVLWGGDANPGADCGLVFALSYHACSFSYESVGSRLVVKSPEIAEYFGKQFKELWKDYLIGK